MLAMAVWYEALGVGVLPEGTSGAPQGAGYKLARDFMANFSMCDGIRCH